MTQEEEIRRGREAAIVTSNAIYKEAMIIILKVDKVLTAQEINVLSEKAEKTAKKKKLKREEVN